MVVSFFLLYTFHEQRECDSYLEETKAHASLSLQSLSDHLFIHEEAQHYKWNIKKIKVCHVCVRVFSSKSLMGVLFVVVVVFRYSNLMKNPKSRPVIPDNSHAIPDL